MAIQSGPTKISTDKLHTSNQITSLTRVYLTKSDTPAEAHNAVLALAKPSGLTAVNADTQAKDDASSRHYFVTTIAYSTPQWEQLDKPENPTDRPAIVNYQMEASLESMSKDVNGSAVVNTLGDRFDEAPQRQISRMIISVTVNVAASSFNPLTLTALVDTYNSAQVTIDGHQYAAKTLLFSSPTAQETWEVGPDGTEYHYYAVSYQLKVARPGEYWDELKVRNEGYYAYDPFWNEELAIVDAAGNRVSTPKMLDVNGEETNTPYYITFKPYQGNAWAGIDFD